MEENSTVKSVKPTKASRHTSLRVRKETKRRILNELNRMNRKDFGRKIHTDDYLSFALDLITSDHVHQIQEKSLSHADRLEREYKNYVNQFGQISKDEYLGKRLSGEIKPTE